MSKQVTRVISTAAVILVAGAPTVAAAAPRLDQGPTIGDGSVQGAVIPSASSTTASTAPGFQWADAGIGAAGVVVLAGIGSGAAAVRQRRTHRPLTS